MKTNYLITFLLLLIVLPLVSSAPPVTTVEQFPQGYIIEEVPHQILKVNTDFIYYFYLYNSSNGVRIDNSSVNCTFNMVDSQGVFLTSQNVSYMGSYWLTTINGSYLDEVGSYYYVVDCQDGFGGALAGGFEVTQFGKIFESWDIEIAKTSIYFLFLLSLTLILLGYLLTNKENIWAKNVGLLLILIGFIFIYYDLVMINTYSETIVLSTSANLGVFKIFIRFIRLMPYIIALISGFAIIKFLREVVNNKKSKDGWDNNNY